MGDEVGDLAWLNGANLIGQANRLGGDACGGNKRFHGGKTNADEQL